MKKIILLALFGLLFFTNSNAACDDPLTEGVDYSNCRFSDSQDLQGSYLPNSNLSFASFIQVNFDKSIMMTSNLSFGTFPESTFVRANLYESVSIGANFEKTNFTGANLTRVDFMGATLIEANFQNSNLMEANFTSSNITNANFDGANLTGATWTTDGSHTVVQSGDVLGQIVFAGNDTEGPENGALISGEVDGTPGSNDMPGRIVFSTTPDGSDTLVERARITSTGNVGIGSADPGGVLDLYHATSNTILNVKSGDAGSVINLTDSATRSSIEQNGTTLKIVSDTVGTYANSDMRLQVDGSTKLLINSSGQVGISSNTPRTGFALDVNGDLSLGESNGTDNSYIDQKQDGDLHIINSGRTSNGATGTSAGGVGINRYNTLAGGTSLFRDFTVYDGKNTKVLVVDGSSGEVGIGTDDPTGAFEISWEGTSTDMIMLSRPSTGGNFARMGHNTSSGTNMLDIRSEGHTRFLTGGNNERLRIDSNGKFCFGTFNSNFASNDSVANFVNAASAGTENPLLTLWNPTTATTAHGTIS